MTIELQITGAALAAAVSRNLQRQLRTTCLPAFAGASIDHLEVVPGGAATRLAGRDVEVRVPVDVFIVLDSDLDAAANGTPLGATQAAGQATFVFRLQVTLSDAAAADRSVVTTSLLQLVAGPPDLGTLAAKAALLGLDAAALGQRLMAALPTVSLDLSAPLARLGVTRVRSADVVLVQDAVAVRFDPAGAPASQLFPGQDWGLFVDAAGVQALLRGKLAPALDALPGATLDIAWAPAGTTAHVNITLAAEFSFGPFDARVVAELPCDLSVPTGAAPALRGNIDWSVHVFLGDLVPGFVEALAEDALADAIDPTDFGATPVGDRAFVIDTPLPALPLLGVVLRYDSVFGSAAGMTIGGAVVIRAVSEPAFALRVGPLGGPTRLQLCSKRARTGSGDPSKEPLSAANTTSYGSVAITGCGRLCAIDLPPAEGAYRVFIAAPVGAELEEAALSVALPYAVAEQLTAPLTFVVRTPRGVRRVDLGRPPPLRFGPDGKLLGGHDYYIPDCLYFVALADGSSVLHWGGDADVLKPPPLEHPDWEVYVQRAGGIVVQLVRATGLEPGELLRFRSATHAIDVVADAGGRAMVPVLLPLSAAVGPARLVRANGRSLEGHVGVDSATFERHVGLSGRLSPAPAVTRSGTLRVAVRTGRVVSLHTVTTLGPTALRGADRAADSDLNPQPLPPGPPPERLRELAESAGLRGFTDVVFVPGFASSGAAVATTADGRKLMLDVGRGGAVRITGTFDGPIGAIDVAGRWAVSAMRHGTAVFRHAPPARAGSGCNAAAGASPSIDAAAGPSETMTLPCEAAAAHTSGHAPADPSRSMPRQ